jgi:hypothetical protein
MLMPGMPEKVCSRLISVGTATSHPFSAKRRANCASGEIPGDSPTNISGVQSASGIATTRADGWPSGCRSSPSPSNPSESGVTGARTGSVPSRLCNVILRNLRGNLQASNEFRRLRCDPRVQHADRLSKALPVGRYRELIVFHRCVTATPQLRPTRRLSLRFTQ